MWSLLRRTRGGSYPSTGGKVDVYLDESADAATLVISDERVARTVRVEGIGFVDLDKHDNVVAIEVLGASKAIERLERLEREARPDRSLDAALRAAAARFVEHAQARLRNGEAVDPAEAGSRGSRPKPGL
jgi:uncharacterized protein YuzE